MDSEISETDAGDIQRKKLGDYVGYLLRGVISANVQIAVLKELLVENNIKIDPDKYEAACLKQQEREIKKASAQSEIIGKSARSATSRASYRPVDDEGT